MKKSKVRTSLRGLHRAEKLALCLWERRYIPVVVEFPQASSKTCDGKDPCAFGESVPLKNSCKKYPGRV